MSGFTKGDPRASAAGRRGGRASGVTRSMFSTRDPKYKAGYGAGWKACDAMWRRRIAAGEVSQSARPSEQKAESV